MNIYTKIYHKSHHGPNGPLIFMIFIILLSIYLFQVLSRDCTKYILWRSLHQQLPDGGRESPAQSVLGADPLVYLHSLLLQDAGEEDDHVTHHSQVQALPLLLPSIANHGMALSIVASRLTLITERFSL